MILSDRRRGILALFLLSLAFTTVKSFALQEDVPPQKQPSRRTTSATSQKGSAEPEAQQASGGATTTITSGAGAQKADDEGRTRLPMEVRRSVSFREIGPAISGGRVPAVVGVANNPDLYYIGAADGGVFRTNDGGVT
jgi:hypothetical protein